MSIVSILAQDRFTGQIGYRSGAIQLLIRFFTDHMMSHFSSKNSTKTVLFDFSLFTKEIANAMISDLF